MITQPGPGVIAESLTAKILVKAARFARRWPTPALGLCLGRPGRRAPAPRLRPPQITQANSSGELGAARYRLLRSRLFRERGCPGL